MILSANDLGYQQCSVTIMDNIADPDIRFDESGKSNYCDQYKQAEISEHVTDPERGLILERMINKIKMEGKGKPYDCITGVSGGVDSSYLILLAKRWGLRPLIVHFDNGWNSEIAVKNINSIIEHTGFNLYTIVVNWEEFRDLQLAYIKSGVVDWEVPTDHAILATWYKLAKKYKINTILSGSNVVTEAIMPPSWIFNKADYVNLRTIHKKFGKIPFKTYPIYGFWQHNYRAHLKGVASVKPLNLVDYNKAEAKKEIITEFGWVDYGGKHYESVYTKFYQAYILPTRFRIDKRKPHLSNLILSGQISKMQALEELKETLYTPDELAKEKEYVLKKLGLSDFEFEKYMEMPRTDHNTYGVQPFITDQYKLLRLLRPIVRIIRK
jgi:N-acetyl sugar amidotransferase